MKKPCCESLGRLPVAYHASPKTVTKHSWLLEVNPASPYISTSPWQMDQPHVGHVPPGHFFLHGVVYAMYLHMR